MTSRFNFFDVYGYLIPGTWLLLGLSAPLFLVMRPDIDASLGSATLALTCLFVLAYVSGLLMKTLTHRALPSWSHVRGATKRPEVPSNYLFDPRLARANTFSPDFSAAIEKAVAERVPFCTPASRLTDFKTPGSDGTRRDVFRMARAAIIRSNRPSYVEQFQGLYEMYRGLCMASSAVALYLSGWTIGATVHEAKLGSSWADRDVSVLVTQVLVAAALAALWTSKWTEVLKMRMLLNEDEPTSDHAEGKRSLLAEMCWKLRSSTALSTRPRMRECPLWRRLWWGLAAVFGGAGFLVSVRAMESDRVTEPTPEHLALAALVFITAAVLFRLSHLNGTEIWVRQVYEELVADHCSRSDQPSVDDDE